MKEDFEGLLSKLVAGGVDFILIGGFAATAHGSTTSTFDLDIVYSRDRANIARLVAALGPLEPYLRGAPPGLPFRLDEETVQRGLNFTLSTGLGALDLFGEIVGGGDYGRLLPDSVELTVFGKPCRCLTLAKLIEVKRSAGRPKDFFAVAELEALREERGD